MDKRIITALLVSSEERALSGLESYVKRYPKVHILRAKSCQEALHIISGKAVDLVVADENPQDMTGLEFIKKLITLNPIINCAVVSSLSPKDFHEASEGLGLLMQLSVRPDEKQSETLIHNLKKVMNLSNG